MHTTLKNMVRGVFLTASLVAFAFVGTRIIPTENVHDNHSDLVPSGLIAHGGGGGGGHGGGGGGFHGGSGGHFGGGGFHGGSYHGGGWNGNHGWSGNRGGWYGNRGYGYGNWNAGVYPYGGGAYYDDNGYYPYTYTDDSYNTTPDNTTYYYTPA